MSNVRVKSIKFGRPVSTKDRLPTKEDADVNGFVLAWSHLRHVWERHILEVPNRFPEAYPYWKRISS